MKNTYIDNIEVPEIVDKKCREAYDMIYKKCGQESKNTSFAEEESGGIVYSSAEPKRKNYALRRGLAIAACAAVVSLAVVPVAAANIPSLKSAFGFISGETYSKDPADKNDLTPYAAQVNDIVESDKADVTLQGVYCDGSNISVALALTPKDAEFFKDTTTLYGDLSLTLDGDRITDEGEGEVISFLRSDDGNYYSVLYHNVLDITESELKINISNMWGENYFIQHAEFNEDGSCAYVPEKTVTFGDVYDFEYTVKPDYTHNKIYEVNETQGDVTLERIEVTPFMTKVYFNNYPDTDNFVTMKDQDDRALDIIFSNTTADPSLGEFHFESPFVDSKSLTIDIRRLDLDDFPADYSFTVNIDEGFRKEYTMEYDYDKSEITYDPPIEEVEKEHYKRMEEDYNKVKETITPEPAGTIIPYGDGGFNITFTNYEVGEISDYDVDEDYLAILSDECDINSAKLMLITCKIENTQDKADEICLNGPELISKDLFNENIKGTAFEGFSGRHYASEKDNYGKRGLFYEFEPHETRTITLGYIVPEYALEAGYWAYYRVPSTSNIDSSNRFEDVLNGTGKLYEIK